MTTKTGQSQEEIYRESLDLASTAPGVIPFMESEVQRFEAESARFQSGEQDNLEFTPFRLRQGVYGQRQADVQMIRVKIPGGILTADAMDALGDIAEHHAPLGKGHITTRENIQFHHIPLPECPDVLRKLGTVGLTSREACGNTVRNVVGSPTAGVDAEEIFRPDSVPDRVRPVWRASSHHPVLPPQVQVRLHGHRQPRYCGRGHPGPDLCVPGKG